MRRLKRFDSRGRNSGETSAQRRCVERQSASELKAPQSLDLKHNREPFLDVDCGPFIARHAGSKAFFTSFPSLAIMNPHDAISDGSGSCGLFDDAWGRIGCG